MRRLTRLRSTSTCGCEAQAQIERRISSKGAANYNKNLLNATVFQAQIEHDIGEGMTNPPKKPCRFQDENNDAFFKGQSP
jgi:hypothetical protein